MNIIAVVFLFTTSCCFATASRCHGKDVPPSGERIWSDLEGELVQLFQERDSLPLSISRQNGNIEVRTKFKGDTMVTIAEAKMVKHHPDDFREFLENFNEAFPKVNPMVRNVLHLRFSDTREGVKSILKFPYPLRDRVMVHWKYLKMHRGKDEHLLIFSEQGNDDLLKTYLSTNERKKFVLGRTFLCAYWIQPVRDSDNRIIGSSIKYAFSGDIGESIPQWLQNSIGPKTALDSINGLVNYLAGLPRR
mmetsp:Transcript_34675/g.52310  ORF Transcript_34675/g.52310 Transcript_34675/m.52310 type:complete len:248 (+) Transcript_34675:115-858(+)